jgi:hypothetical protein
MYIVYSNRCLTYTYIYTTRCLVAVFLVCLSLPPWLRGQPGFLVLAGIIPGPRTDNVRSKLPYMRLIQEQFDALGDGIRTYNALERKFVTINNTLYTHSISKTLFLFPLLLLFIFSPELPLICLSRSLSLSLFVSLSFVLSFSLSLTLSLCLSLFFSCMV